MPPVTLDRQSELGLVAPPKGVPESEPETRVIKLAKVDANSYRKLLPLNEEQKARIKKVMKEVVREWKDNTRYQNNKLRSAIDRLEGIAAPKDYPWPNSSNLNIPYSEIQILVANDIASSTMLDSDPVYFIKEYLPAREGHPEEHVDPAIETWLNWVFKNQLNLDEESRLAMKLAFRDPLSILVIDWVEEKPKEYRCQVFETVEEFQREFPSAEAAGIPQDTYEKWMGQLGILHEPLELEIEERVVRYRGPKARVVELKDFIRSPVACKDLEHTRFHGDQYRMRKPYFQLQVKLKQFYADETAELLKTAGKTNAIDDISQALDTIEGISSNRSTPDEYDCVRGNLKIDLNNDDEEEMYHVVYNYDNDKLLRVERYPYWHNRSNYIPYRIERKPNRLLGRCFMDKLYDINEEINTQHNQRIDSRTITTVPSFKIQVNETDLLTAMERKDRWFYPGCRFPLSNMNNLQQLETKVYFQGTLQEEQNLFAIGDMLTGTGAAGARSAQPAPKDPRASGKKQASQIQQSNNRIDGYIRELKPSQEEAAAQVLELYYQFSPESVIEYASYDETTGAWVRNEIERVKLRNRNMTIQIARSSVLDSPDAVLQRALTDYQIWKDEPLIGQNLQRRWELVRATMFAERKPNVAKLLPPLAKIMAELQEQDKMAAGSPSHQNLLESAQNAGHKERANAANGKRQGSPDMRPSQLDRSAK